MTRTYSQDQKSLLKNIVGFNNKYRLRTKEGKDKKTLKGNSDEDKQKAQKGVS